MNHVRLRDEFCDDLGRYTYKQRRAADTAHAEKAGRLAAAAAAAAAGRCAEPGCAKPQACGVKDSNRAKFCRDHTQEGEGGDGERDKCTYLYTHSGCIIKAKASHGLRMGAQYAEVCLQHARAGMVSVASGKPKPKRGRSNSTDLLCALTGASSNSNNTRARRVGILQRTSPIQPDTTAVKKEVDESWPSNAPKVHR